MSDSRAEALAAEVLSATFLRRVPEAARRRLLAGAMRLDVPSGAVLYREGDRPRLGVMLSGLIRIYLTGPDGRQVTVRYAGRGEILGAPTAVAAPVDVGAQALTDSTVLLLDANVLRDLARSDAALAWAVAEEVSRRLYAVLEAFAGATFGSVRQRVVRHLLDVASAHQSAHQQLLARERPEHEARLLAPLRQQELADATGSVREVVARVLRDLRDAGLVETSRRGIWILDPVRLHAELDQS